MFGKKSRERQFFLKNRPKTSAFLRILRRAFYQQKNIDFKRYLGIV